MRRRVVVAGPKTDFFAPELDALKTYLGKNGKLLLMLDPPENAVGADCRTSSRCAHEWGIDVSSTIVVDASGMGRLIGADASVPIAANYPSHPITERFTVLTAYPLSRGRSLPVEGGVNGHTAADVRRVEPAQLGGNRREGAAERPGEVELDEDKGDKPGPIDDCRGGRRARSRDAPATPDRRRRAEAGNARGRLRRLRLRRRTASSASRATTTCS